MMCACIHVSAHVHTRYNTVRTPSILGLKPLEYRNQRVASQSAIGPCQDSSTNSSIAPTPYTLRGYTDPCHGWVPMVMGWGIWLGDTWYSDIFLLRVEIGIKCIAEN